MDHLKSKKQPVRKTVWVAGDSELADEVAELETSLSREESVANVLPPESSRREAVLQTIKEKQKLLETKKAELESTAIKFVFQSIGRKRYEALLEANPPTDAQIEEQKKVDPKQSLEFNPETFPIALIIESLVEPDVDRDELRHWILNGEEWNTAEFMTLFMAALEANSTRKIINSGKD